jgi:hypothetical protein
MCGHPDIHRAAIAVRHDVDPAAFCHRHKEEEAGLRVKPGVTKER